MDLGDGDGKVGVDLDDNHQQRDKEWSSPEACKGGCWFRSGQDLQDQREEEGEVTHRGRRFQRSRSWQPNSPSPGERGHREDAPSSSFPPSLSVPQAVLRPCVVSVDVVLCCVVLWSFLFVVF